MTQRHAVIDLANAAALRGPVLALDPQEGVCLLDRQRFPDLAPVGPWLIDLALRPWIRDALRGPGRGRAWGYVVYGERDLLAQRHHLRKFNRVRLPGRDAPVLFRYFDPVVLHRFLTSIFSAPQIASFCDGITALEVEAEGSGSIDVLRPAALIRQAAMPPPP
jgi:hypothetical protein